MTQDSLVFIFVAVFAALFISVFFWFYLCMMFDRYLEQRHPEKFVELGEPHIIKNNTISNNILFFRFIFGNGWKELSDPKLNRMIKFMKGFMAVYLCGLLSLAIVWQFMNAS